MNNTSEKFEALINDMPVIKSDAATHTPREQSSFEKLEHMLMSFEYGMSQSMTRGLDEKLSGIRQDFNAGQALAQQGEAAMKMYIGNAQKTVEAMLDTSTLSKVKLALETNAERLHSAYARGDYNEMGSMTGAAILASIDPDKLKQLERFKNVANGVEHVEGVAEDAIKKTDKVLHQAPYAPKPYANDANPGKAHDPDLMRGRQTGPVTIGDTVYESGKEPRKLSADERTPMSLVDKDERDPSEVLKPRSRQQSQVAAPVQDESEHLALKAGLGLTTIAGLAFGAVKYHEAQRTHRTELNDAYRLAVDVNNYADNPESRLSRYTATIEKHPELENAIKLFEGARATSAKDGFNYQEVEALKQIVVNTTESIHKNELSKIAVPNQIENQQAEHSM